MKRIIGSKDFKKSLLTSIPEATSYYVIENFFIFDLKVSPSEIWPFLCDTSRMNREIGLPPRIEEERNGELHVFTKTLGRTEHWIEKPWVWLDEKELQMYRVFENGWMTEQRGVFKVFPTESGCQIAIFFRWSFSNIFSRLLFAVVSSVLKKKFNDYFKVIESSIVKNRVEIKDKRLIPEDSVYEIFLSYLKTADELDLDRIHLKKVARILNVELNQLFDVTRKMIDDGYLQLSWDVVCPHCRGVRSENSSLAFIEMKNNCESCEIEFAPELEESVEVVFHVTPKVRTIQKIVYCAAEPAKKKHIKLHQILKGQEKKSYELSLQPGIYRLRGTALSKEVYLEIDPVHSEFHLSWDQNHLDMLRVNPIFSLSGSNLNTHDGTVTLEEAWWFTDRLWPREILGLPKFRDLFSEEHIKIGVKLNVGKQVILFTDIVGSTDFYKSQGDAKAIQEVQKHYTELKDIITSHHGVIVKYIGDAVMASFLDVNHAYRCSLKIHECFRPEREDCPIRLRVSFHEGRVLCANMNVGLDYFGNTVNVAAKMQKWINAHEVAMSEADWNNLEVRSKEARKVFDEKLNLSVYITKVF